MIVVVYCLTSLWGLYKVNIYRNEHVFVFFLNLIFKILFQAQRAGGSGSVWVSNKRHFSVNLLLLISTISIAGSTIVLCYSGTDSTYFSDHAQSKESLWSSGRYYSHLAPGEKIKIKIKELFLKNKMYCTIIILGRGGLFWRNYWSHANSREILSRPF